MDATRHYIHVQKGDTLGKIAEELVGSAARRTELLAANTHKRVTTGVGGVPTFATLHVGEKLFIPAAWAGALGRPMGLGAFNPSGNNFVVDAQTADLVCSGNFVTASGNWPPSIYADIVAWASSGVQQSASIFVWSGDDKNLYQFVKTDGAGAATLMMCTSGTGGWVPGQPIPGQPGTPGQPGQPGGGGGGVVPAGYQPPPAGTTPGSSNALTVAAVVGVAALVGIGGAYLIFGRDHKQEHPAHMQRRAA